LNSLDDHLFAPEEISLIITVQCKGKIKVVSYSKTIAEGTRNDAEPADR